MVTIFNLPPIIFAIVMIGLASGLILLGYYIGRQLTYFEVEMDMDDLEQERDFYKTKYTALRRKNEALSKGNHR